MTILKAHHRPGPPALWLAPGPTTSTSPVSRRPPPRGAQVTVVVEAVCRSGSWGTAAAASAVGRAVAAVPGPVTSIQSQGCHRLLREGAIRVTSAEDLAQLCGPAPRP